MNPADLRAFAGRDRKSVADLKSEYWVERKRRLGPAEGIRVAEALRLHVRRVRPDWPDADERRRDHEIHCKVGEMLRRVRTARPG
jgi:hypothetical protein